MGWRFWLGLLLGIFILYWVLWGRRKRQSPASTESPSSLWSEVATILSARPEILQGKSPLGPLVNLATQISASPAPPEPVRTPTRRDASEPLVLAPTPRHPEEPDAAPACPRSAPVSDVTPVLPPTFVSVPTGLNNQSVSKGQRLACQALEQIYGTKFQWNHRPNFLRNPETNRNLELDCYNDRLKIGLEYSGKQHYVYPNHFHRTYEEFLAQVRRDRFKVDCCDREGVYLITVPYNVPYDKIAEYVRYYTPEAVMARQPQPQIQTVAL